MIRRVFSKYCIVAYLTSSTQGSVCSIALHCYAWSLQKALIPRGPKDDGDENDDGGKDIAQGYDVVDLSSMGRTQRRLVVERAMATSDQDNEKFLQKYADRLERCALTPEHALNALNHSINGYFKN